MLLDWLMPRSLKPNLDGSPDSYLRLWGDNPEVGVFPVPDKGLQCTKSLNLPNRVPTLVDYGRLLFTQLFWLVLALVMLLVVSDWFLVSLAIIGNQLIKALDVVGTAREWQRLAADKTYDALFEDGTIEEGKPDEDNVHIRPVLSG